MRGQESEGSGQHHIFTLNNYHSVQQEGTFMNPSSHNSGARESVEVFFGVSKIPIWGWIHHSFLINYMYVLTHKNNRKKKTNKLSKEQRTLTLTLSCPFTDDQYFMSMFYNLHSGSYFMKLIYMH